MSEESGLFTFVTRGRFETKIADSGDFTVSIDGIVVGTIKAMEIADLQQVVSETQKEVGRCLRHRMMKEGPYWP